MSGRVRYCFRVVPRVSGHDMINVVVILGTIRVVMFVERDQRDSIIERRPGQQPRIALIMLVVAISSLPLDQRPEVG